MASLCKKPCSICHRWFRPDPRVGSRQRTCGQGDCQTTERKKKQAAWRGRNPDYFRARRIQGRHIHFPSPQPGRLPSPLNQLPWDLAQEKFGVQGADFLGAMGKNKKQEVRSWLKRHPRFVLHFVPISSSWLNLVERWFGELWRQYIRRGAFFSVDDLEKAIRDFLATWNENPKPFVWTATVESITEKLSRCRQTLEKIQPGCTLPRRRKKSKKVV